MAENFELTNNKNSGMKIQVELISKLSAEGRKNLNKRLKRLVKRTFKPLGVIFLTFEEANTQEKFANFIYNNFGANKEGKSYKIIYWRKVNHWARRYAKLCWIRLYDLEPGKFRYEYIRGLENLRRFTWFHG